MLRRALATCALSTIVFALHAAPSPAPVPPKDCGFMTIGGQRYQIKADIRCKKARTRARRYLKGNGKPEGWNCTRYSRSQTAIAFRCTKGNREIFAVRR